MLTRTYHYNQVIKRCVAVFGTIFNNITIGRVAENGRISNIERVPISYGPKQKFLDRITQQPDLAMDKVAIKVPRLSFEVTSIAYDTGAKLNRMNQNRSPISGDTAHYRTSWQSVPYVIGMELNVYGRNQDDVLQCVEQILPQFQPEYTIVVKDLEAPGISVNVPITLNSINLSDDYAGSMDIRRTIVYTLGFSMRVRFSAPPSTQGLIRFVEAALIPTMDVTVKDGEFVHVGVSSTNDVPDNFSIISTIDTFGFDEGFSPGGVADYPKADSTLKTADGVNFDASIN